MKVDEVREWMLAMVYWTGVFKTADSADVWSEEEKQELHELAWQLVNATRPKEGDDG